MKYLQEHPFETQCISLRWINDLNKTTNEIENELTAGFGYFVNLKNLELWAKDHITHLNIYNTFMNIASNGNLATAYLWHEVYVVSLHNQTGFLRWYAKYSDKISIETDVC